MAKMITVDGKRCLACKACEIECALAHTRAGSLAEALQAGTPLQPRVHVEPIGEFGMPLQCRHCEDAPCVSICPTNALEKSYAEGPVLIDVERCIGCKFCIAVCPFGVITLNREGKAALKCDLCIERLEEGQEPACVEACQTGALRFGEVSEEVRRNREKAARRLVSSVEKADKIESESGS